MRMFYARGSCDDEDGFEKIVRAITRFKNNYCIVTHKPSGGDFRGACNNKKIEVFEKGRVVFW